MNNRNRHALLAVVLAATAAFALAGCASGTGGGSGPGGSGAGGSGAGGSGAGGSGGSTSPSIAGTWRLESGADAKGAISPGAATVTFRLDGDSSGGHGPCNSFGATTRGTTTGTIAIVVGIHTDMACVDPDLNTTETRYFAALNTVTKAALASGTLTLSGGGDTLVFAKSTT